MYNQDAITLKCKISELMKLGFRVDLSGEYPELYHNDNYLDDIDLITMSVEAIVAMFDPIRLLRIQRHYELTVGEDL
jgi:hypothetical protein